MLQYLSSSANAPSDQGGIEMLDATTWNHTFDAPRCTVRETSLHSSASFTPNHGRRPRHRAVRIRARRPNAPSMLRDFPQEQCTTISRRLAEEPLVSIVRSCLPEPAGAPVCIHSK